MEESVYVPADVPYGSVNEYLGNYDLITQGSGRLMLLAGDQKVEHLNEDFYGEGIHPDDNHPEHLFKIAAAAEIGVFAAQQGLISMYGPDYPEIPYLVKLNSKTHLVKTDQKDPLSNQLIDVEQVAEFKKNSGLDIAAVGYTIYLGSEYEHIMLREAAQAIYKAHHFGLVTVLWIYPRGKAVKDEKDPDLIAGATGVAATLGSDFVKVNAPKKDGKSSGDLLIRAVKATGRNIHQKSFQEAVNMCNAIAAITIHDKPWLEAIKIHDGK
jgi:DhnA family fructose-bisphosphate aldolase class Ia